MKKSRQIAQKAKGKRNSLGKDCFRLFVYVEVGLVTLTPLYFSWRKEDLYVV